jgi:hypothetical protein
MIQDACQATGLLLLLLLVLVFADTSWSLVVSGCLPGMYVLQAYTQEAARVRSVIICY